MKQRTSISISSPIAGQRKTACKRTNCILISSAIAVALLSHIHIVNSFLFTPLNRSYRHSKHVSIIRSHTATTNYSHNKLSSRLILSSSEDNDVLKVMKEETPKSKSKSILARVDELGINLKPNAMAARDTAALHPEDWKKNAWYTFKACSYLSLFIAYRAYRGFFVVLPAVFKEVSLKLQSAVDRPFDDNDNDVLTDDVDPNTGKLRKRTRVTVSILAVVLTSIYAVSGACKVFTKFISTIFKTNKVEPAFEAAADEIEKNEGRILKVGSDIGVNGAD